MPLQDCYHELLDAGLLNVRGRPIEPWAAVSKVDDYRHFFRPEEPRVVLLAESHRFNGVQELERGLVHQHLPAKLNDLNYPHKFVQFVYCLGCGENELLDAPLPGRTNSGTPQFWKLFYSCIHFPDGTPGFFSPVLKRGTALADRIGNKTNILMMMKQQGIWLLDASITAIDGLRRQNPEQYKGILDLCWRVHIGPTIREIEPRQVVVVGMGVREILGEHLEAEHIHNLLAIHQPQSRNRTPEQRLEDLQQLHGACQANAL